MPTSALAGGTPAPQWPRSHLPCKGARIDCRGPRKDSRCGVRVVVCWRCCFWEPSVVRSNRRDVHDVDRFGGGGLGRRREAAPVRIGHAAGSSPTWRTPLFSRTAPAAADTRWPWRPAISSCERAYLEQRTEPGAPLLVLIAGRLEPTPAHGRRRRDRHPRHRTHSKPLPRRGLRGITLDALRRSAGRCPPPVAQMHPIPFDGLDSEALDHPAGVKLDAVDLGEGIVGAEDDVSRG